MLSGIKRLFRSYREAETIYGLITWDLMLRLFPWVATVATFVVGWLTSQPLMWVVVGCSMLCASLLVIISKLHELAYQYGAKYKLALEGIDLVPVFDESRRPVALKAFDVRVGLANTATFPISYVVDDWSFVFNGRTTTENKPAKAVLVPPMSGVSHRDIEVKTDDRFGGSFPCRLKFKIRYGKPGAERFHLEQDLRFDVQPSPGEMLGLTVTNLRSVQRRTDGEEYELHFRPSPLLAGWTSRAPMTFSQAPELR